MSVSRLAHSRAALMSLFLLALAAWPAMRAQTASAATAASSMQCAPGMASLPDFSPLVAKYGPAVVNIEVIEKETAGGDQGDDRATGHQVGGEEAGDLSKGQQHDEEQHQGRPHQ